MFPLRYPLLTAALAASLALTAGCSAKPAPAPEFAGTPYEVTEYAPDLRDHHTSWGHSGRGGAALRKPSYQPVLGSPDVLETRYGKMHPELQPKAQVSGATVAVPPGMLASKCIETNPDTQSFPDGALPSVMSEADGNRILTLANRKGSVDDYIAVRNKLCKGADRLTYEEWEILVMGTPKDVPLRLQPTNYLSK